MSDARWEWHVLADRITWSPELYAIYGLEPRETGAPLISSTA